MATLPPNGKPALQQRLDPAHVRAQEQSLMRLSAIVVDRAMGDVRALNNALHFLTEQANMGNAGPRDLLKMFFDNLAAAKAASVGITVARDTAEQVT